MEIGEFAAKLLSVADMIHECHLKTTSYAEHKALGIYGDVRDFADDFVETWQGQHGLVDFDMVHVDAGLQGTGLDAVMRLVLLLNEAKADLASDMSEYGHYVNKIEELLSTAYSTIYKLRFLK